MKKATVLLLVFAILVGMLPLSVVTAASTGDLTSLAAYLPADTSVFVGLRTDDAFITEIEGLLNLLAARLPAGTIPPVGLFDLLDMAIAEVMPEGNFQRVVRSWLGDTAVLGVLNLDDAYDPMSLSVEDPPVVLALSVTNRAAAEELVGLLMADSLASGFVERGEEGPFTTYKTVGRQADAASILIGDDVLLVTNSPLGDLLQLPGGSLADNEAFIGAFDLLPAESYNILVYVDSQGIIEAQANQLGDFDPEMAAISRLLGMQGPLAMGFTMLDGHVLTMDIATRLDREALQATGEMLPDMQPINPAFAEYLPAGAQFVILGTGIWGGYQSSLIAAQLAMEAQGEDPEDMYSQLELYGDFIEQMVGLDYEEDLLSWMTEDFALYFMIDTTFVDTVFADPTTFMSLDTFPLDFGFLVAATDDAAARNVVAQLSDALPALLAQSPTADVTLSQETIAGSSVLALTVPVEDASMDLESIDLLLGANDEVFVLGTRGAVTAALDPQTENLRNSPGLEAAAPYLLEPSNSVWYISTDGLSMFIQFVMLAMLGPSIDNVFESIVTELETGTMPPTMTPEEREAQNLADLREMQMIRDQIQQFLSLFENLTISVSVQEGSVSLGRFTIGLAAE